MVKAFIQSAYQSSLLIQLLYFGVLNGGELKIGIHQRQKEEKGQEDRQ